MASCLQKLLKKPPPTRLIFSLHTQQSSNLTAPPLLLNHQAHIDTVPDHHHHRLDSFPPTKENLTNFTSSFFYPSFPFGFFLDPILSTGSILSEPDDVVSDDVLETVVWADSVKKKRKKKMNKHKYKKLRKRLRRQT
ncbi:DUF1713 domain-containing protein [Citrus sinensis]|uniref:DUF1713 domain-containing protein n=1 Tax=Citrus sinensis TaxID=2711 RepID=A0ACB8MYY1_CITSI|nr:DUF1713 domain-containing protein [Citrus sinensis]